MTEIRIRLLGGFELNGDSKRAGPTSGTKTRALIAVLARHPGRGVSRQTLAAMLWPESDERSARASLRQSLKLARRALDDRDRQLILGRDDTLSLQLDADAVDVSCFERGSSGESRELLERTAKLYRGELLAGHDLVEGPLWEWLTVERARLHELAVVVYSRLLARQRDEGDPTAAITTAVRLLSLEPVLESVHRQLIEMYVAAGRLGMARAQYRRCCDSLKRELGIGPDPATGRSLRSGRLSVSPDSVRTGSLRAEETCSIRDQHPVHTDEFLSRPAVAVLPFDCTGEDPEHKTFTDGLRDDVVTALGHWRSFPVISGTPSHGAELDDDVLDVPGVEARYIVRGVTRHVRGRRWLTVHLLDRESGRLLWGERFDAEPHDLSAVEDELARTISAITAAELERAEQSRVERRLSGDLDAWEHVMLGNALLQRCTERDNILARSSFQKALARDPAYGDAFAGMAFGHLRELFARTRDEREGPLREGERAACRAVALDCNSSVAHHALATAHVWAGRDEMMLRETELAVELNPSNAGARMALGNRLDLVGRTTEGIAEMVASLRLDPRNPRRFVCMGFLARALLSIGDHEKALNWAYQAVRLRPDLPDPHFRLALCLGHLGRVEQARAALDDCERLSAGSLRRLGSWCPYANEGRSDVVLEGLRRHGLLGNALE